jgi:hypothetical protein
MRGHHARRGVGGIDPSRGATYWWPLTTNITEVITSLTTTETGTMDFAGGMCVSDGSSCFEAAIPSAIQPYSFGIEVQIDSYIVGDYIFASIGVAGNGDDVYFYHDGVGNFVLGQWGVGTSSLFSTSTIVGTGKHSVIGVVAGSYGTLYLDGVAQGTPVYINNGTSAFISCNKIKGAGLTTPSGYKFNNLRFWNRALTAGEIF